MKTVDELAEEYVEKCRDNMHSVNGIAGAYCVADFKAGHAAASAELEILKGKYARVEAAYQMVLESIAKQAKELEKLRAENFEMRKHVKELIEAIEFIPELISNKDVSFAAYRLIDAHIADKTKTPRACLTRIEGKK